MIRATTYSQILAKAGAERSYLLSKRQLRSLAECENLSELMSQLRGSPYEHLLRDIGQASAAEFQRIFREELVRVCDKIMDFSPKNVRGFLKSYLRYLEIENLKILIKMKSIGVPSDSLLSMLNLSVEEIFKMRERFIRAAKAKDVNAVVEIFKDTMYGSILSEGLTRYRETGLTRFFDFSLDRSYHDDLLNSAELLPRGDRETALLLAGLKVDAFNIITAIRSKFLEYPPHLIFWAITRRFYRLSEKQIREIVSSSDVNSALDHVRESFYGKFLASHDNVEELITDFQRKIDYFILDNISKKRIAEPFTIATPLDVILKKEVEVKNLILISSGIEFGWKSESIVSILL